MLAVPANTPVTVPVEEPTVATAGVPLDHVPDGVPSASVVDKPTHATAVPVIAAGSGLTVTITEE